MDRLRDPPAALINVGELTSFHEDNARLIPLLDEAGGRLDRVVIGRMGPGEHGVSFAKGAMTIACTDAWMSSPHAAMRPEGGGFVLEDMGSRNGIVVGGRRVLNHGLSLGDVFVLGRTAWGFLGPPYR